MREQVSLESQNWALRTTFNLMVHVERSRQRRIESNHALDSARAYSIDRSSRLSLQKNDFQPAMRSHIYVRPVTPVSWLKTKLADAALNVALPFSDLSGVTKQAAKDQLWARAGDRARTEILIERSGLSPASS